MLGYASASKTLCEERGIPFQELWGENARHYYVHGKDNIPFHTIILPALLLGHGGSFRLPDDIISSEHLTLEGKKISTSQNWAIWAKDLVTRYHPDALRYFFIANGPEKRDTDFSWQEFVEQNNSELLGAYGNLIHRTLAFLLKYKGSAVPNGRLETEIATTIQGLYDCAGSRIESGQFRDALEDIFAFVRFGNKYFDSHQPWKTRTDAAQACDQTLFNCIQIIANLAVLLAPFLPFSSAAVCDWLHLQATWAPQWVAPGYIFPEISVLFERLETPENHK